MFVVSQFDEGAKRRYHLFKELENNVGDSSLNALFKQQITQV